MSYGEIKIDTITFTAGGVDTSIAVSGLVQNPTFTGNITTTGTISGDIIRGSTVSGATVTGTAGEFGTITGNTAGFTTVTGTTVTGTTANFVTVSGTTVTGATGQFTNITGVNIVGTTLISGTTVTGNVGSFTTLTGGTVNLTSGVFASGTAAAPSVSIGTTDNGFYSPGADQVAISTSGTQRISVDASGTTSLVSNIAVNGGELGSRSLRVTDGTTDSALIYGSNTGSVSIQGGASQPGAGIKLNGKTAASDPATIQFFTEATSNTLSSFERLRITSDGKVGLGTSSPSAILSTKPTSAFSTAVSTFTGDGLFIASASAAAGSGNYGPGIAWPSLGSDANRQAGICSHQGTADPNQVGLSFFTHPSGTSGDPLVETVRISYDGKVGVGTTSPDAKLNVVQSSTGRAWVASGGQSDLIVERNGNAGLAIVAGNISNSSINFGDTNDENAGFISYYHDVDALVFRTGGVGEDVRIDSSGRLLVGTSSSAAYGAEGLLQILGTTNAHASIARATDNSAPPSFNLAKARGSTGAPTIVSSGDSLGRLSFAGYDGTDYVSTGAWIEGQVDGTPGTDDMPGRLVFSTTADGASTPTENMRIDSNGVVKFQNGTASNPSISFLNDPDNGIYRATTNSLGFVTAGTEAARIDSSGRLLVGTSSNIDGQQVESASTSGNNFGASRFANNTGGCDIFLGKSRGATVGTHTIVQSGDDIGNLYFRGSDGTAFKSAARIHAAVDGTPGTDDMPGRLVFSTTADGASSPTERMRITSDAYVRLASGSGGIQFNGDTAAANALDDYEEGTFTPTIVGTTTAGTGTYTIQVGVYTKVGNVVHYAITVSWTAHTGTGNMRIDGLPFTASNLTNYNPSVALDVNNLTSPANTIVTGTILSNTTLIGLNSVPVAGGARASLALDTAGTIWASGSYTV